jgi:hypothetical protein
MWNPLRRRKMERLERTLLAANVINTDDKGLQLERCASDVERRALCLQWASDARTEWYAGRRRAIARVVLSDHPRYKQYNAQVRASIGEQQWGRSVECKDLASLEQMYSRWAQSYAGGPGSDR